MRMVISFVLLVMLIGCLQSDCKLIELPKKDKEWIKNSKVGDKLAFISSKGRSDTLNVKSVKNSYTQCNKIEIGNEQYNYIEIICESKLFKGLIYLDIAINYDSTITKQFKFIDLRGVFLNNQIENQLGREKLKCANDSVISYKFNLENSKSDYKGLFKSFSWSKSLGILRYETKDGEVFERVEL